jgi:hypothetical protein
LRTARGCFGPESESFVDAGDHAGATGRARGKKSIEEMGRGYARLDALSPDRILEHFLIGATDDRNRPTVRAELGTYLQTDDERDRNRQNPEGDVRKEKRAALHDVVRGAVRAKHGIASRQAQAGEISKAAGVRDSTAHHLMEGASRGMGPPPDRKQLTVTA